MKDTQFDQSDLDIEKLKNAINKVNSTDFLIENQTKIDFIKSTIPDLQDKIIVFGKSELEQLNHLILNAQMFVKSDSSDNSNSYKSKINEILQNIKSGAYSNKNTKLSGIKSLFTRDKSIQIDDFDRLAYDLEGLFIEVKRYENQVLQDLILIEKLNKDFLLNYETCFLYVKSMEEKIAGQNDVLLIDRLDQRINIFKIALENVKTILPMLINITRSKMMLLDTLNQSFFNVFPSLMQMIKNAYSHQKQSISASCSIEIFNIIESWTKLPSTPL